MQQEIVWIIATCIWFPLSAARARLVSMYTQTEKGTDNAFLIPEDQAVSVVVNHRALLHHTTAVIKVGVPGLELLVSEQRLHAGGLWPQHVQHHHTAYIKTFRKKFTKFTHILKVCQFPFSKMSSSGVVLEKNWSDSSSVDI